MNRLFSVETKSSSLLRLLLQNVCILVVDADLFKSKTDKKEQLISIRSRKR